MAEEQYQTMTVVCPLCYTLDTTEIPWEDFPRYAMDDLVMHFETEHEMTIVDELDEETRQEWATFNPEEEDLPTE